MTPTNVETQTVAQTETGGQAQHPMLIDIDNRIAHLKRRLEFRPECERPENERLLAKARAERDRWLADNPTNVDTAARRWLKERIEESQRTGGSLA